jgi:hypothetical protein
MESQHLQGILYRIEEQRGYEAQEYLWSPGYFRVDLAPDHEATLIASTETWETMLALEPRAAYAAELERRRRLMAAAHPAAAP